MGRLVVSAFVTLDGIVQAPGGPDEDADGFTHGGWSAPYATDEMNDVILEQFKGIEVFLLGRRTYEIFAGYWPKVTDEDNPVATKLNGAAKYVASRTLDSLAWNNSHLLAGDAGAAVAELKERIDGEINVQGSADLIRTLQRHELVDEYRLLIEPVVLGTGKRLFAEGTVPAALRLVESRTTSNGIVYGRYRSAGRPTYGTVGVDG
jgi:dihydrofolate reductase